MISRSICFRDYSGSVDPIVENKRASEYCKISDTSYLCICGSTKVLLVRSPHLAAILAMLLSSNFQSYKTRLLSILMGKEWYNGFKIYSDPFHIFLCFRFYLIGKIIFFAMNLQTTMIMQKKLFFCLFVFLKMYYC